MSFTDDVAAQLSRELGSAAWDLGSVIRPSEAIEWQRQAEQSARGLAMQICSSDDDEAADAVANVLAVLWSRSDPEDQDPDWWRSPLGRACARSLGREDAGSVSHSVAAAMLGTSRGSVSGMVSYGTLDRHPDGGVLRSSVLHRIGRSS